MKNILEINRISRLLSSGELWYCKNFDLIKRKAGFFLNILKRKGKREKEKGKRKKKKQWPDYH